MPFDRRKHFESISEYLKEVLANAEGAIPVCDCGAGDLCVSVELKALIEGTATQDQQRDIAACWSELIVEKGRREEAQEEFLAALERSVRPQRDPGGNIEPPLMYNGPKKGTQH